MKTAKFESRYRLLARYVADSNDFLLQNIARGEEIWVLLCDAERKNL
jgi:hypothetical protein